MDRASGERFRMAPFSVIVSRVVEWTIAVSGAKQFRFRLENGLVWTGPYKTCKQIITLPIIVDLLFFFFFFKFIPSSM